MEITLKAGTFSDGNVYALQVILDQDQPSEKRQTASFPTPQQPAEAAKSLHALADWINSETANDARQP
jgi:hypothetical protein